MLALQIAGGIVLAYLAIRFAAHIGIVMFYVVLPLALLGGIVYLLFWTDIGLYALAALAYLVIDRMFMRMSTFVRSHLWSRADKELREDMKAEDRAAS